MESQEKRAYLRQLKKGNQCQLTFSMAITSEKTEEFRATRQITDSVESLLLHIKNKLENQNIPMTEGINNNICCLKSKNKNVKGNTSLKELINQNRSNLYFTLNNTTYKVLINAPLVLELTLPSVIYCGCNIEPKRYVTFYSQPKHTTFDWFKSLDKVTWTLLDRTHKYLVKEQDVGHYFKLVCVPGNPHMIGPPVEAVSMNRVESMVQMSRYPFEERHKLATKPTDPRHTFRIVSYNILSDRYADTEVQFPYCSPQFLSADYRKQLTVKELLGYQADIITLQEVDKNTYKNYYKNIFKTNNYNMVFHMKGNRVSEGLACIYKTSRYKSLSSMQIVLSEELQRNDLFKKLRFLVNRNTDVKGCINRLPTSLQIIVLKDTVCHKIVIVANTHLFYHPDATHIRLLQAFMTTKFVDFIRSQWTQSRNQQDVVTVFCGDFNAVPTSSACRFLIDGVADEAHDDYMRVTRGESVTFTHDFTFESACGLPKYTNYTLVFKDCLDYIFIDKKRLGVVQFIPFPDEEELSKYEGLPNQYYPSDHLPLVVDLKFL